MSTPARTLSTAEERREDVLRVAMKLVGERGLYGTPTLEVAKAAGISQAYLFRLFPTKTELFLAVLDRCFKRINNRFVEAAREARRAGEPVMATMGGAYTNLLREEPALLLTQLQGQAAAASEPEVREALRRGFRALVEMTERETGASPLELQQFFARGMLCNVIAAMQLEEVPEDWAELLTSADATDCD